MRNLYSFILFTSLLFPTVVEAFHVLYDSHDTFISEGVNINDSKLNLIGDALLVFFGLSPKLGPIAEWGLDITKKSIKVDTESYQTNIPGIFGIGDISDYPGKKKLILSGFHEAALAAFAAKAIITPGKKVNLQYTTTSPLLKERLGVSEK